eukprot:1344763-Pyramimonas_sp.AAC.1
MNRRKAEAPRWLSAARSVSIARHAPAKAHLVPEIRVGHSSIHILSAQGAAGVVGTLGGYVRGLRRAGRARRRRDVNLAAWDAPERPGPLDAMGQAWQRLAERR